MNIIAVDDEALALGYMLKILKEAAPGSRFKGFEDPFAALDYLRENPVDIAFLDIEMYGLNGIELAKRFKEAAPSVKIIFSTGFPDYALDAFSVHASGYLLKPPTVDCRHQSAKNGFGYRPSAILRSLWTTRLCALDAQRPKSFLLIWWTERALALPPLS